MTGYYYVIYIKDYELKEIRRVDTMAYVEACYKELNSLGDKNTNLYIVQVYFDDDDDILEYKWHTPILHLCGTGLVTTIYNELNKMIKNYQKFLKKQLTNN